MFPATQREPVSSFRGVAEAVASAVATHGVLPIESSLAGAVPETDDLLNEYPLSIVAEAVLPITHALLASRDLPLSDIRLVRSHPSALDQCRRFLHSLSHARIIATATTADAARETAKEQSACGCDRKRRSSVPVRARVARGQRQRRSDIYPLRRNRAIHPARRRPRARKDGVYVRGRPPAWSPACRDRTVRLLRS